MFVLSFNYNPCIHVFTLSGEKSRSLVTRVYGRRVKGAYFFCLDGHSNIVVSDELADRIRVFSPEGNFLHMIGQHISTPYGIGIPKSKRPFVYLVLITLESKYIVHNYCYFAFQFSSVIKCKTLLQLVFQEETNWLKSNLSGVIMNLAGL